jgi:RES domain-containing protein
VTLEALHGELTTAQLAMQPGVHQTMVGEAAVFSSRSAYEADNMSGAGAKVTGGRWNAAATAVVYTSQTRARALACLETVVHLNAGGLPLNRYLVKVTIPEAL